MVLRPPVTNDGLILVIVVVVVVSGVLVTAARSVGPIGVARSNNPSVEPQGVELRELEPPGALPSLAGGGDHREAARVHEPVTGLSSCSPVPCVADTLVLFNNTLVPGNFLAGNGISPVAVAYDSEKGEVFVANHGVYPFYPGAVSVISDATNSVVATVPVGFGPEGVAYDSGRGEVFVANLESDTVSVISDATNSVVATVPVAGPFGVAYDSGKGEVFVANYDSNTVSVISDATNSVVATVAVGSNPYGVAYDSGKGEVFVANYNSDNVSVISDATNSVVATVPVGFGPDGVAYDSGNGHIYVSNSFQGTVSIISPGSAPISYAVMFSESGLPFGTNWSVTLSGDTESSTVAAIGYSETNGTYSYSIGSVMGYTASPLSGNLAVSGNNVTESITFSLVNLTTYRVTFTESGLPSGTAWSVTLGGVTHAGSGTTITFTEPNGTYDYAVGPLTGYASSPPSGSVSVAGTSQTVSVTFAPTTGGGGSSAGFLGLSGDTGYYVLGGIAAAIVIGIAVALVLRLRRR